MKEGEISYRRKIEAVKEESDRERKCKGCGRESGSVRGRESGSVRGRGRGRGRGRNYKKMRN